uniref:Lysosome-associated membrane glycoprotein 2-like luminal domain-containing protein n=1 Tax=Oncorhynchus tshawytscha TaxID=74940 RepID=A0AAZ3R939_ONCTS
ALASAQEDTKRSKPSATVFPPFEFGTTSNTATTTTSTTTTTALPTTESQNNTSTAAPTTTLTPTTTASNSTTADPTTANTTTAAPTTPTPPANLTVGNYTLKSEKGLCLMAQLALQIRVEDTGKTGVFIVQPVQTHVKGGCEKSTANLTLTFKEGFITFMFNKNTTQNAVYVDTVSFSLSYPLISGDNGKMSLPYVAKNGSLDLFLAKVGHSYSCKSESVFMGKGLYLDITQDRIQAFNITKEWDFGTSDPCPADRPADYRVAIAVGIVLLILIIIVVVAYLLSRRKRSDGYQSL